MRKGFFAVLSIAVLIFGLAGSSAAEEGVTDTTILIGSHQDFSGPAALWGQQVSQGMKMRAQEIKEAGGIYGRNLEFVFEDDGWDPKKAIMVTNKMINRDKVFAFVCNMGSATALATKPIISRKKIPQLFPVSAATGFFDPFDRYCFAGFTPYYDQARALVKYFVENMGLKDKRFGYMYQDDEMGHIMKQGVEDQLKVYNINLVESVSYKRGAIELTSQVARLRKAHSDVVILGNAVKEIVMAVREMHVIGWNPMVGTFTTGQTKFVNLLATKSGVSADGLYCCAMMPEVRADSPRKTVRDWWQRHVQWYGKDPDGPTTAGYNAIVVFEKAARKVGKDLTREKWIDALETFRDEPDEIFGSVPLTYTPTDHQGPRAVYITQMKNGKYEQVSDFIDYRK